jgi:hypothetical protein
MISRIKLFIAVVIFSALLFLSVPMNTAFADHEPGHLDGVCADESANFLGFPTWYKYLERTGADCSITLPQKNGTIDIGVTVGAILLAVVEILLWIAGIVGVGFVVYGGVLYTLSQGAPDKTVAAKNTILNGIIGLVIAILAQAIVSFVLDRL